uniref:NADH-ubiquinone oxidoreductase chain 4 n=1 Tax=Diplogonoporus grandis TaxID=433352 RepID=I0FX33_DIPGA|nr:NADH dehydrogenase subunit 4 [Diplogonoporus grandis]BAL73070.1 NADH dehydrogenase subunit 4 [Diplogonoporus grandis]
MSVYNFISFGFFLAFGLLLFCPLFYSLGLSGFASVVVSNGYFLFDSVSFYLILLVFFLGLYGVFNTLLGIKSESLWFLGLSLAFTVLCFCSNHCILFWCFYELSMLPLLYLIFCDSPYSERFIAGWYFAVYLLFTSLPLILILLYLSYVNSSLFFSSWSFSSDYLIFYVVLAFIFFTKVPLFPFHTWLPIVHAEATSIVSMFLSGYIMKLGILGIYRCTPFIFSSNLAVYIYLCCIFSVFFLITASSELDGKRWLAFLSLSHILVPLIGFFVSDWSGINLSFFYCLGHGVSAGLVFGFLWFFYDVSNTRNLVLLKSGLGGLLPTLVVTFGLLSLCSFPPTIQFFCEVFLLSSSTFSVIYCAFWGFYLFFAGLVPLVLCGHILIRGESFEGCYYALFSFSFLFLYLCFWCYLGIFMI